MTHPIRPAAVLVALISILFSHARGNQTPPTAPSVAGLWQGKLKVGVVELRLVFKINQDDQGQLQAKLDSPDQGAKDIPIDQVKCDGTNVKLELSRIKGAFEGKLNDDGQKLEGTWTQLGRATPLTLARIDKLPEQNRPQVPKKPYPYVAEEVTYDNTAAGIKLVGTLTLAKSDRPTPAALLITGSGAQDRDETLLGHKPFLIWADYLTRRGISVLRVDDRGVGGSTGNPDSTTDDFAGDVLAGVAYLKTRREIDPRRIGVIGHSEGGIIGPLAASRSSDVAFVVMMAGTGVTGEEIIYRQQDLISQASGGNPITSALSLAAQRRLIQFVKEESDAAALERKLREALAPGAAIAGAVSADAKKEAESQIDTQVKMLSSVWFRYFVTHDPQPALRKVRCPVLVLNGEKDLQVEPEQNLPPIERALKEGGNADFTIMKLPGLNHLFQHCQTGSPSEYGTIEETIAPEALAILGDWIIERTK